jgi:hypothetical protein
MGGHDTVGARPVAREERCDIGVRGAVRNHAPDEAIAERRRVGGKAFCPAEPVCREAISHDGEVLPLEPVAAGLAVFRSDLEACGILERNSALIHAR